MLKQLIILLGLALIGAAPCQAVTVIDAGIHIPGPGINVFPIIATSDSGERLSGIDLYLVMEAGGPLITNVDLINGTVFESNNVGQLGFGLPEHETPTREPSYYTTTAAGTVPTGIVAWITIDWTGVAPRPYTLSLNSPSFGHSAVYNDFGEPGTYLDGIICPLCPEPGSIVMALFGAAGLGAVAIRHGKR